MIPTVLLSTGTDTGGKMLGNVLWAVVVVLVVLWLIGFVFLHASSALIHILLVIALIVLIYNLITRSRASRRV